MPAEGSTLTSGALLTERRRGDWRCGLQTPEKIRTLQRKLYLKAKAEPDFRFYLLYDKVYREDILFHAYRLARSNKGAPGVDGQSFEEIEAMGLEGWLSGIRDDLRAKTYRPEPVRRAMVPKPGGGERPLGIPTIRDRVVQGAVKLVIEPRPSSFSVAAWRMQSATAGDGKRMTGGRGSTRGTPQRRDDAPAIASILVRTAGRG